MRVSHLKYSRLRAGPLASAAADCFPAPRGKADEKKRATAGLGNCRNCIDVRDIAEDVYPDIVCDRHWHTIAKAVLRHRKIEAHSTSRTGVKRSNAGQIFSGKGRLC